MQSYGPDSSRGDAVNIWREEVAAPVTGHVGIAEIVGKYKYDVRRLRGRLGMRTDATGRKRSRPEGDIAPESPTGHSRLPSHRRGLSFSRVHPLSDKNLSHFMMSPPRFADGFAPLGGLEKIRGSALDLSNAFVVSLLIYISDH